MTRNRWIALAAALLALISAWSAYRYGTRYCAALKVANLAKEAKDRVPTHCADFWLNRYQTLIAAILAVAAAFFSIKAVRDQTFAGQRTNENVARLAIYDALRVFILAAFDHIRRIGEADKGTLEIFDESPPEIELAQHKVLAAHLPPKLAQRVLRYERQSAAVSSNRMALLGKDVPLVQLYTQIRLAQLILEGETLAADLGMPIEIFDPQFNAEVLDEIKIIAQQLPARAVGGDVEIWLNERKNERIAQMTKDGRL